VQEGPGKVRITAINGPSMCGADYPFKVSMLGASAALSYDDYQRPPSGVPNGSAAPRWPIAQGRPSPPPYDPNYDAPPSASSNMRWTPGPAPAGARPETGPYDRPLSLDPPAGAPGARFEPYDFRRPYGAAAAPPRPAPGSSPNSSGYDLSPVPYENRRTLNVPAAPSRIDPIAQEIMREPARASAAAPPLGPARSTAAVGGYGGVGALGAVALSPPATLACPVVSVLDHWIAESVQPAALHWFGQPVIEIKQISAYSCRGMNGDPRAKISEHAFGNALDIATFILADGHKITVQGGWKGAPEEQGFLRDVQAAACDQFTTVLAPGSNAFHYNHIHVDLMRRASRRRSCNPHAVSGEEVAARARATYAGRRYGDATTTTGSIARRSLAGGSPKRTSATAFAPETVGHILPLAIPGADGED
jgi:hypothetical protein